MSAQLISERMLRDQVLGSLDWIEQKRRLAAVLRAKGGRPLEVREGEP